MLNALKWFFGFVEYTEDEIEGALSWQHILSVSLFMVAMVGLAILFGILFRNKEYKVKNRVLIVSAMWRASWS